MAGATLERQLSITRTTRVRFDIASQKDDAAIRRLLRETPMVGQVSISLEREPNYFADAGLAGESKQTIVAYDNERLACVGSCAIRRRFVNGQSRRVGYLGSLRMDHQYAGRFDIVRRGYQFFHELQTEAPADLYFTSIAADNERALRFLERGAAGMPLYEFAGEFVTILIPTNGGQSNNRDLEECTLSDAPSLDQLAAFLNGFNQQRQFAPCWSTEELHPLQGLGLRAPDFCPVRKDRNWIACGAVWDQRSFKQTVIRDYAPWLKWSRPIFNGINRALNRPQLPMPGTTLSNAFASHLAFASDRPTEFLELTKLLSRSAHERGIKFLTLGLAANDTRLIVARKAFSGREYRSRLYVVRWPGIGRTAAELDGRPLAPEVALL